MVHVVKKLARGTTAECNAYAGLTEWHQGWCAYWE